MLSEMAARDEELVVRPVTPASMALEILMWFALSGMRLKSRLMRARPAGRARIRRLFNRIPERANHMSISSAMLAGVTGLTTNSSSLAAISDNIANANTVGYKQVVVD